MQISMQTYLGHKTCQVTEKSACLVFSSMHNLNLFTCKLHIMFIFYSVIYKDLVYVINLFVH